MQVRKNYSRSLENLNTSSFLKKKREKERERNSKLIVKMKLKLLINAIRA